MPAVKNSATLDRLIEYAKNVGINKNATFSAERFIIALCDFVEGSVEGTDEQRMSVRNIFAHMGVDTTRIRAALLEYIDSKGSEDLAGSLSIQRAMYAARMKADETAASELTPEMLLASVLEAPSEIIRKNLPEGAAVEVETPVQTTIQTEPAQPQQPEPPQQPAQQSDDERAAVIASLVQQFKQSGEKSDKPAAAAEPQPLENPKKAIAELTAKVKSIRETLLSQIYGQDNAISVFSTGYFQAELLSMTDRKRVRPRATFLFAGPPGVGKTFLAEKAAEVLGLPFMRFDMSEYSTPDASVEFCGSDKVYKNGQAGNVTGFVEANPKCLLLFDEIEKAHMSCIQLFLQMLDAGRLRDNYTDTEVPFTDAIIIFTTNAGKQIYEQSESGDFSTLSRKVILKSLQSDTSPITGAPFFPAAICSRFASGNVVMFNHIAAHDLREIAKREVLRHATNFQREIGIDVEIDEDVFTALLFAEGGAADARTIRARSESFFDDELFELFRLVASDGDEESIEKIEKIRIGLELPKDDEEIQAMFSSSETPKVLAFAAEGTADFCSRNNGGCTVIGTGDMGQAISMLRDEDVKLILIDIGFGRAGNAAGYLNVEDVESVSRDFFRYVRENHSNIPVYLVETADSALSPEERVSYMRLGVRGVLPIDNGEEFASALKVLCENIHQQNRMNYLAKSNKIVSFGTAQRLVENGTVAEIKLFDFQMSTAVDAEDSENILSSVSKPNVRFANVIGAEDAKTELQFFVDYLKNPKKFAGTGLHAPKGVILYGPPGTGKTMLAKAMACESDVTFITAEGNQFLQKYVGEGKDKVHELFRTARKYAPSILFVDEIDAIAKARQGGEHSAANGEDVLTAFLAEMDGFKNDPSKPVFVLAATNFDVEPGGARSLDPALMRRFDRRVYIDLPNKEERIKYLNMKIAANKAFELSEEEIGNIAIRSTGMSLAELESIVELALRSAIRDGSLKVTDAVFEEAFETFNSGEAKKWDSDQLERVARHEAGHAFLCWKSGETPSYLTIVARGDHGGYMQHDANEGKAIYTKEELLARIRTSLGGRAAEIVYYGTEDGISTGASGDLATATSMAQRLICTYGMDSEFGLAVVDAQSARMGEVSSEVRIAVNKILAEEMADAMATIERGKPAIDAIVAELMSKNHLTGPEIDAVFSANCPEGQDN